MEAKWFRRFLCALALMTAFVVSANSAQAQFCPGDCNLDEVVAIDELILGVNITLKQESVEMRRCSTLDTNADERADITELVAAVGSALEGCPPFDAEAGVFITSDTVSPGDTVEFSVGLRANVNIVALDFDFDIPIILEQSGLVCETTVDYLTLSFRQRQNPRVGAEGEWIRSLLFQLAFPFQFIPDGTILYTCTGQVPIDAPPGEYPLTVLEFQASNQTGTLYTDLYVWDGHVVVEGESTPTPEPEENTPTSTPTPTATPTLVPPTAPATNTPTPTRTNTSAPTSTAIPATPTSTPDNGSHRVLGGAVVNLGRASHLPGRIEQACQSAWRVKTESSYPVADIARQLCDAGFSDVLRGIFLDASGDSANNLRELSDLEQDVAMSDCVGAVSIGETGDPDTSLGHISWLRGNLPPGLLIADIESAFFWANSLDVAEAVDYVGLAIYPNGNTSGAGFTQFKNAYESTRTILDDNELEEKKMLVVYGCSSTDSASQLTCDQFTRLVDEYCAQRDIQCYRHALGNEAAYGTGLFTADGSKRSELPDPDRTCEDMMEDMNPTLGGSHGRARNR